MGEDSDVEHGIIEWKFVVESYTGIEGSPNWQLLRNGSGCFCSEKGFTRFDNRPASQLMISLCNGIMLDAAETMYEIFQLIMDIYFDKSRQQAVL
ncbi:hypothetical protein BUALT_Bualt01G0113900 [Buddleja alternifolia]|uniref:Uncharacterized protein n=1 Tax=Buddleja alternifolia TaxID=168488 RepID=A0AAV6Y6B8_9LAMI|nr:hypothetical protein BUALT_Bualt01G0113900 [Buddleja alternifolia]